MTKFLDADNEKLVQLLLSRIGLPEKLKTAQENIINRCMRNSPEVPTETINKMVDSLLTLSREAQSAEGDLFRQNPRVDRIHNDQRELMAQILGLMTGEQVCASATA